MLNQLESEIKELIEGSIAEGKQCPSAFDIDTLIPVISLHRIDNAKHTNVSLTKYTYKTKLLECLPSLTK